LLLQLINSREWCYEADALTQRLETLVFQAMQDTFNSLATCTILPYFGLCIQSWQEPSDPLYNHELAKLILQDLEA
jgi:hypothetical protein